MNTDDAFERAALYETCQNSKILRHLELNNLNTDTIRELINKNNNLQICQVPIILSKAAVKFILTFIVDKFPSAKKFITPENIQVRVESDELICLKNSNTFASNNIVFIVAKNIIISCIGVTFDDLQDVLINKFKMANDVNKVNQETLSKKHSEKIVVKADVHEENIIKNKSIVKNNAPKNFTDIFTTHESEQQSDENKNEKMKPNNYDDDVEMSYISESIDVGNKNESLDNVINEQLENNITNTVNVDDTFTLENQDRNIDNEEKSINSKKINDTTALKDFKIEKIDETPMEYSENTVIKQQDNSNKVKILDDVILNFKLPSLPKNSFKKITLDDLQEMTDITESSTFKKRKLMNDDVDENKEEMLNSKRIKLNDNENNNNDTFENEEGDGYSDDEVNDEDDDGDDDDDDDDNNDANDNDENDDNDESNNENEDEVEVDDEDNNDDYDGKSKKEEKSHTNNEQNISIIDLTKMEEKSEKSVYNNKQTVPLIHMSNELLEDLY